MPRRQNRITNRALEVAGITGTPGPDVSDNIQLTYSLGDLSPLMPGLPYGTFWATLIEPAVAGEQSGMDLRPPSDSLILIHYVQNLSAQASHFGLNNAIGGTVQNVDAPTMEDPLNVVSRSILRSGTNFGPVAGVALAAGAVAPANLFPMRLSPGNVFAFVGDALNTIMTWLVIWTEAPQPPVAL